MQVVLEPADFNQFISGLTLNSATLIPANNGAVLLGTFRLPTWSLLQIQPGLIYTMSLGKLCLLCWARGLNVQNHFPGCEWGGYSAGMKMEGWDPMSVNLSNLNVLSSLWFPGVLSHTATNGKYSAKQYRDSEKNPATVFMLLLLSRSVTLQGLDSAPPEMLWLLWCFSPLWWSPQLLF